MLRGQMEPVQQVIEGYMATQSSSEQRMCDIPIH